MGVTRWILQKEVRTQLDRIIPKYRRTQRVFLRVDAGVSNAALTGMAFDYAVRFELQRRYGAQEERRWTAEKALARLTRRFPEEVQVLHDARRCTQAARRFLEDHVHKKSLDVAMMLKLAEHALNLARIDPIQRDNRVEDSVTEVNSYEQVQEILELVSHVPFEQIVGNRNRILLNPSFGGYLDLEYAGEPDLMVGDRLIDFKVAAQPFVERQMVRQIVAYMMLAREARRRGADLPQIEEIGLYLARHAHLWLMPTSDIIHHPDYAEVEQWFLEGVQQRFAGSSTQTRPGTIRPWTRTS